MYRVIFKGDSIEGLPCKAEDDDGEPHLHRQNKRGVVEVERVEDVLVGDDHPAGYQPVR